MLFRLSLLIGALLPVGIAAIASPSAEDLKTQYPVVVYRGPKKPREIKFQKGRPASWVPLNSISRLVQGAVIVSEDWSFYSHPGYDVAAIKEAIQDDIEKGEFARGASTITQQVAKNVFLENEKTLIRKAREFVIAIQLEKSLSKRKILEIYLNVVEFGEGIFGISAASRKYFGKAPSELLPKEAAFLAMLLPSPKRYSQSYRDRRLSPYARRTIARILQKMTHGGYLSEGERQQAVDSKLSFEVQ